MTATRAIDSDIRPISDLRNKFAEIADYVQSGRPVILPHFRLSTVLDEE